MQRTTHRWLPLALAGLALGFVTPVTCAQPIAAGDLIIFRVGDGSAALSANATSVFLDEYSPAGALVRTIPVPSTGTSTGVPTLTVTGNATTEGIISRSQDGNLLVFTGYRKDAGGSAPASDLPSATPRVIGTLNKNGTLNTSIAITDGTAVAFRSATTVSGSSYYTSTAAQVGYVATPGPASTTATIDARNSRQVVLSGNTLYASNGSTTITAKVQSYGPLPTGTTAPTPVATLATADAVNGFLLLDLNPQVAGDDTLYALSTVEGLLRKYTFDGTAWAASGSVASGAADLTGFASGTTAQLYLTSGTTLFSLTDASGSAGTLAGTPLAIATAATNTAFRGVALLTPVPEPASLGLVGFAGVALLARRLRRRKPDPA